jgi:CRISPR-associated protein Csb2
VAPPKTLTVDQVGSLRDLLAGMTHVKAGRFGVLSVRSVTLDDEDRLLHASRTWRSTTKWQPMRHRKTGSMEGDVRDDLLAEHRLQGLPEPTSIEILAAKRGARGGLEADLRLTYPVAVSGPLMLGRSAMKGGGLFAATR